MQDKFGRFWVVATGADTADVYASSNGIASSAFTTDTLKIGAIDVSLGADVLADYGLTFTPNGTAAFVTDDVMYFDVRPINSRSYSVDFGAETAVIPEVEIEVWGQNNAGRSMVLRVPRAQGGGVPITMAPDTFGEYSIEFSVLYCSSLSKTHTVEFLDDGSSGTC